LDDNYRQGKIITHLPCRVMRSLENTQQASKVCLHMRRLLPNEGLLTLPFSFVYFRLTSAIQSRRAILYSMEAAPGMRSPFYFCTFFAAGKRIQHFPGNLVDPRSTVFKVRLVSPNAGFTYTKGCFKKWTAAVTVVKGRFAQWLKNTPINTGAYLLYIRLCYILVEAIVIYSRAAGGFRIHFHNAIFCSKTF
jgi:hypothetical protein